jgi:dTDP-4-dehydrorhamnose 3,5-epimerase
MDSGVTKQVEIDGVVVTALREISDERGSVLHMLRSDAPDFVRFGECYFSEVLPRAIKAWKSHRRQTQNFAVPVGRIRIAIYDGRERSPTRAKLQVLEMGRPDAYFRLRVPPGVWYGFTCVGAGPALVANCPDLPHDPAEGSVRPADDPLIPYRW